VFYLGRCPTRGSWQAGFVLARLSFPLTYTTLSSISPNDLNDRCYTLWMFPVSFAYEFTMATLQLRPMSAYYSGNSALCTTPRSQEMRLPNSSPSSTTQSTVESEQDNRSSNQITCTDKATLMAVSADRHRGDNFICQGTTPASKHVFMCACGKEVER
jgi:hypothetical protein